MHDYHSFWVLICLMFGRFWTIFGLVSWFWRSILYIHFILFAFRLCFILDCYSILIFFVYFLIHSEAFFRPNKGSRSLWLIFLLFLSQFPFHLPFLLLFGQFFGTCFAPSFAHFRISFCADLHPEICFFTGIGRILAVNFLILAIFCLVWGDARKAIILVEILTNKCISIKSVASMKCISHWHKKNAF